MPSDEGTYQTIVLLFAFLVEIKTFEHIGKRVVGRLATIAVSSHVLALFLAHEVVFALARFALGGSGTIELLLVVGALRTLGTLGSGGQVLDGQRNTIVVEADDLGFDLVAHVQYVLGGLDLVVGDVRDVNQTVNARLDADESTKLDDGLDGALDDAAHGILLGGDFVGLTLNLLEGQGDLEVFGIDFDDQELVLLALSQHVLRIGATHPADLRRPLLRTLGMENDFRKKINFS